MPGTRKFKQIKFSSFRYISDFTGCGQLIDDKARCLSASVSIMRISIVMESISISQEIPLYWLAILLIQSHWDFRRDCFNEFSLNKGENWFDASSVTSFTILKKFYFILYIIICENKVSTIMIQHHIKSGIIRLTEAKAVFPTKLDTKSPSTTL